jgi:hypothetical protein
MMSNGEPKARKTPAVMDMQYSLTVKTLQSLKILDVSTGYCECNDQWCEVSEKRVRSQAGQELRGMDRID